MDKICSICKKEVDSESAPILVMGGFGNPRYMCDECANDFDEATASTDVEAINSAMDRIGERIKKSNVDDELVLETVDEIMSNARSRGKSIMDGTYDFGEDESVSSDENEIPEELLETEEDKEIERVAATKNAKLDKITNWICLVVLIAALGFMAYRLISMYF